MTDIEDINLPEPLKIKPSIAKYLDSLEEEGKTIFGFAGASFVDSLSYLFLLNKYKSNCVALSRKDKKVFYDRPFGLTIHLKVKYSKEEEIDFRKRFTDMSTIIANCVKRGEQTIIIPLGYERGRSGHSNILILRMNNREIEHFEPHGGEFLGNEKLQLSAKKVLSFFVSILNKELKKYDLSEVKYVEASEVCPYISGLQVIEEKSKLKKSNLEPGGYCTAWSMFFAELCLKNPDISSSKLLDNIYNYLTLKDSGPDYLRGIIRGYAGYIIQKIDEYLSIFFKPNITAMQIINKPMSSQSLIVHDVIKILANIETYLTMNPDIDIRKELKRAMKEYRDLTKGKTKEEQIRLRRGINGNQKIKDAYYKKRILQNYEEYKRVGRVMSEPVFDSPEEIDRTKIKNLTILEKGLIHEKMKKEKEEYEKQISKTKKQTPEKEKTKKTKTRKNKLSD